MCRLLSISAQPEFEHLTTFKRHSDWCSLKCKSINIKMRQTVSSVHTQSIYNYWKRLSRISRFLNSEQINYLSMPKAICFLYLNHSLIAYFSPESVVTAMHEQNIIRSETRLEGTTYE